MDWGWVHEGLCLQYMRLRVIRIDDEAKCGCSSHVLEEVDGVTRRASAPRTGSDACSVSTRRPTADAIWPLKLQLQQAHYIANPRFPPTMANRGYDVVVDVDQEVRSLGRFSQSRWY
jgi:hypothetical protein